MEIKTDSEDGSGEIVRVGLRGKKGRTDSAGNFVFQLTSPPKYGIGHCIVTSGINFPTNLPTEISKIWRITLSRTSGNKLLVVHCNGVEVLNFEISETSCADTRWSTSWNKDVAKIYFHPDDTASDQYRFGRGSCNKIKWQFSINKIPDYFADDRPLFQQFIHLGHNVRKSLIILPFDLSQYKDNCSVMCSIPITSYAMLFLVRFPSIHIPSMKTAQTFKISAPHFCPEMIIADAQVLPTRAATENTVATVTCLPQTRYVLIGGKEVTCQSTGWTTASGKMPECRLIGELGDIVVAKYIALRFLDLSFTFQIFDCI